MIAHCLLATFLVFGAVWTVLARSLIHAAIGLGVTSAVLTAVMFQLEAPLAGVFELSVCTGLISVVFVATIGLTKPVTPQELARRYWSRFVRFAWLPPLLALVVLGLAHWPLPADFAPPAFDVVRDPRVVLWQLRQLDLLAQLLLLLVGVFGVVTLFRDKGSDDER